jgi:hypothetical protein
LIFASLATEPRLADAYLNIAERVIAAAKRPLRPAEIIRDAYLSGLSPQHLRGPRQDKTLHARLSEDISRSPEASRFVRAGPGVFFLKALFVDPDISAEYKQVYLAPPRRKELRRHRVLTIHKSSAPINWESIEDVSIDRLSVILDKGLYSYKGHSEIKEDVVIHSFVVVTDGSMVLSYRSGRYRPSTDPILGSRSIGLGGAVLESDPDMLYESMVGIISNGIDELGYGIGLPGKLAEEARYNGQLRPSAAIVSPCSNDHPTVIHVVLTFRLPTNFSPTKSALSVNDLRWLGAASVPNRPEDYDGTSRFLFESGRLQRLIDAHG